MIQSVIKFKWIYYSLRMVVMVDPISDQQLKFNLIRFQANGSSYGYHCNLTLSTAQSSLKWM